MVDPQPQFETEDLLGSTNSYSGTVGTSWVNVPAVSNGVIQSFFISCDFDQDATYELSLSFDGGTTTSTVLSLGGFFSGQIRGGITQLSVKGSAASVAYKITLNREPV